jgi:hypothetical protein
MNWRPGRLLDPKDQGSPEALRHRLSVALL